MVFSPVQTTTAALHTYKRPNKADLVQSDCQIDGTPSFYTAYNWLRENIPFDF